MEIRSPHESEIAHLARLWYDGWQDGHAEVVPAALKRARTLESFRDRIAAALPRLRVVGPVGQPAGFYLLRGSELNQLYVAAPSRGTGVAAVLIAAAEQQLASEGVTVAWLSCAIGNDRAARFYEKRGWRRVGNMNSELQTVNGPIPLETWRYEKDLTA